MTGYYVFYRSVLPSCEPCFSPSLHHPLHVSISCIKHSHFYSDLINGCILAFSITKINILEWCCLLNSAFKMKRLAGEQSGPATGFAWSSSMLSMTGFSAVHLQTHHLGARRVMNIQQSVHCLLRCSKDQCVPSACEHTLISFLLY